MSATFDNTGRQARSLLRMPVLKTDPPKTPADDPAQLRKWLDTALRKEAENLQVIEQLTQSNTGLTQHLNCVGPLLLHLLQHPETANDVANAEVPMTDGRTLTVMEYMRELFPKCH